MTMTLVTWITWECISREGNQGSQGSQGNRQRVGSHSVYNHLASSQNFSLLLPISTSSSMKNTTVVVWIKRSKKGERLEIK